MPKSSYVYESGDAIDVGSHGETDFVYVSGEPVPNTGRSTLVYESGTGIGGRFTATLRNEAGDILETIQIVDDTYDKGGIALHFGFEGGAVTFDHIRTISADGSTENIIDSFEDGDTAEYNKDLSSDIDTQYVKDGTLSITVDFGSANTLRTTSTSGLPYYPVRGDTIRFWVHTEDGTDRIALFYFGGPDGTAYRVGFDARGRFQLTGPDDSARGGDYDQTGEWWDIEVNWI